MNKNLLNLLSVIYFHLKTSPVICITIIYQLLTGLFVIFSPIPINVARLGWFYQLFPYFQFGGFLMLISATLATHALLVKRSWNHILYLPQYFFLILSAGSVLAFIVKQQYADGVLRPWPFIFIDQLLLLIVTGFYSFVIIRILIRKENE